MKASYDEITRLSFVGLDRGDLMDDARTTAPDRDALDRRTFVTASLAAGASLLAAGGLAEGADAAVPRADTIVVNGRIATLDSRAPFVDALAIKDGVILATGSDEAIGAYRGAATQVIDAQRRTVIPGLNDSHTHFLRTGINYALELRWDGVPSLADALALVREQARRTPPPFWVQVMGGFSAYQFAEKRLPTLDELNAAAPDTPVYVLHLYDRALINRAGLRALGWDVEAPQVPGGYLERDAAGRPTGLLVSQTSLAAVVFATAKFAKLSADDQALSTRWFMREMNRLGVTSVNDAGGAGQNYPDNYAGIMQLARANQISLRVAYSLFAQRPGHELDDFTAWVGQCKPGGDELFRLTGAGEYLTWSSVDPANFAKPVIPNPAGEERALTDVVTLLAAKGWPFRMHATYDETVTRILAVLENVHREIPLDRLRWTIDHAETISPRSLERVAKLGGTIAIQNRMSLDGEAFLRMQGAQKAADAPPIRRIREMGIPLAAGTDGTRATSYNPWVGLHWLITGETLGGTRLAADRNLVDRMEALRLYSAAGAYLTFEEHRKGTLEPGKLADLAILSADYFSVPADEVKRIDALLTLVGGRVVHAAEPYAALAPPPLPALADWMPYAHGEPQTRRIAHAEHTADCRCSA
jgi:predicted amidohydrolase YtcJ